MRMRQVEFECFGCDAIMLIPGDAEEASCWRCSRCGVRAYLSYLPSGIPIISRRREDVPDLTARS